MAGVSIEDALELWASSLRDVKARMRPLFTQERVAASAGLFLDGLLGPERRKTGWMRAEAAGDPGPWRQQAILGRGHWDADALRDIVRDYALETLADPDAVLVIDETGFLKQGKASCGVARQYTGSAGKITNCQIGVFAAYVSRHGHAFIDRALYLPKAWTDDPARLAAAHVPQGSTFATKPQLALAMIERAIAAGVPFAWVAADSVYGVGEIEMALRRAGKGYVLGVNGHAPVQLLGRQAAGRRHRRGDRARPRPAALAAPVGRRRHQGAAPVRLGLPRTGRPRGSRVRRRRRAGFWTRGLLIRRSIADGELRLLHHLVPGRAPPIETLVAGRGAALGDRGRVRDRQERARARPQRDPLLARLASPRLARHARLRHAGDHPPPRQRAHAPKNPDRLARPRPTSSAGRSRRSAASPSASHSDASNPPTSSPGPLWRRAHQAAARRSHLKRRTQL